MPQTVCLCMIVKDEERVVARCLASVRSHIDRWCIVDTGSTDATMRIVREALVGVPGELHERPWRDFGANRTEALELAQDGGEADYLLVIDADEELVVPSGHRVPALTHDQCLVRCQFDDSDTSWYRPTFARASVPWRYEGVLHEYLTADVPHTTGRVDGVSVLCHPDGARNADERAKYRRDARLLKEAIKADPGNARYAFYLAQSYRDAGDTTRAHDAFARRAAMGGWPEEAWFALYQVAVLKERLKRPWPETLTAYLAAYQSRPTRAEPLQDIARHYRATEEWHLAKIFARAAIKVPLPVSDLLFVEASVYEWRAQDELAVATYWLGEYRESAEISARLLASGVAPAQRERFRQNLEFAQSKLAEVVAAPKELPPENRKAQ